MGTSIETEKERNQEFKQLVSGLNTATAGFIKSLSMNSVWISDKNNPKIRHEEYFDPQIIPYIIYDENGVAIDNSESVDIKDYEPSVDIFRSLAFGLLISHHKLLKEEKEAAQLLLDNWLSEH